MIKAISYARKSTAQEKGANGEDSISVEEQVQSAREFAKAQGWEVVAEYKDDAVSGWSVPMAQRPEGKRLLADAVAGQFQVVITRNASRIGREQADNAHVRRVLAASGVKLFYYQTGDQPHAQKNRGAIGKFMDTTGDLVSELHAEQVSVDVRNAQEKRRKAGAAISRAPYGFRLEERGGFKFYAVVDEHRATIVRVFQLASEGLGARRMADQLRKDRVPAPTSSGWTLSAVKKLLQRDRYQEVVPELIWSAAQKRIKATSATYARTADGRIKSKPSSGLASKFFLSGFASCAICDSALLAIENGRSYLCSRAFRHGMDAQKDALACETKRIPLKRLDADVLAVLNSAVLDFESAVDYAKSFASVVEEPERREAERQAFEAEVKETEAELQRLVNIVAKGLSDSPSILAAIKSKEQTLAAAQARLEHAQGEASSKAWYASPEFAKVFKALTEEHKAFLAGDGAPSVQVQRAVLRKHLRGGQRIRVSPDGAFRFPAIWDTAVDPEVEAALASLNGGPSGERAG